MEFLNLQLFIRICAPLCTMFLILTGRARKNLFFLIIGICIGLFCGEVNGLLYRYNPFSEQYFITNITPVIEETAKIFPILVYLIISKPDRKSLLESAMAVGIGFAILENMYTLAVGNDSATLISALVRGFLSGMLHAFSTLIATFGISFVKKNRRLFLAGTITFLTLSITLHSIYNCISYTNYWYISCLVILLMFASTFLGLKKEKIM